MSIIKNKHLRRSGCKNKKQIRKARKYSLNFLKSNRGYAINNICFNMGLNNKFIMQSTNI